MIGKEKRVRESMSLKTDDIPGASPQLKGYQYTNKPSYINSTTGIDKSSPHSTSFTTNRQVNPLTPNYKLPSSPPKQYTPPKFIRDTLDTRDIQGTSPTNLTRNHIRNTLDVSDIARAKLNAKISTPKDEIPGTSPRAHVNVNFPPHNRNFDVSDIQGNSVIAQAGSCLFEQQKLRVKDLMNCKVPLKIRSSVLGSLSGNASPNFVASPLGSPKNGSLNNSRSLNSLKTNDTRKSLELKKEVIEKVNDAERRISLKNRAPLPRSPVLSPRPKK